MSVELTRGEGDSFELTGIGWAFFLRLAERYGWRAAGTLAPADRSNPVLWGGAYDSSDGQTVAAHDAENLGEALLRCHADPTRAAVEAEVASHLSDALSREVGDLVPIEPPDDDGVFLHDLATFCARGEFRIW